MLDKADNKVSYYNSDDFTQIIFDLLEDDEVAEALKVCQNGLEQHPNDEILELIEARIFLQMNRHDEAEKIIQRYIGEKTPSSIGIRFGIDVQSKKQEDAYKAFFGHLKKGDLTSIEFIEVIEELFDHLPERLTSKYLVKAANLIIKKKQKTEEQDAEALSRIGALLVDCECFSEAIPVLEHAIDLDAYDVYTWQDLARCQFELEMLDECRNSCEMGLAIDPQNPLFNFALGYIKSENGENAEAVEHLEIARQYSEGKLLYEDNLGLDREDIDELTNITYALLGSAYSDLGQNDKALECFKTLVHRDPEYTEGYYNLAMLSLDKGNTKEALEYIEEAIQAEPDNTEYLTLRVTLLTDLHRFDDALKGLDELIKLQPRSKAFLLAKAELALNLKRNDEADKAYRKLLKLKPKDSASREMMRAYFEAIGDKDALEKLK